MEDSLPCSMHSSFQVFIYRKASGFSKIKYMFTCLQVHLFTCFTCILVYRTTWRQIESQMTNIGTLVFLRIFDQNPKVKRLFPFHEAWGDELLTHPMFRAHAYR